MNTAVFILAGGSGIRLWPLSRKNEPKQFLPLLPDGETFFRKTLERAKKITDISHIFVLTQSNYLEKVRAQAPELFGENIIAEPVKRNTAPGIAVAVMYAQKKCGELNCIFMPSDHYIENEELFCDTLLSAANCAEKTKATVTIGIKPDRPATCYGYIKCPSIQNPDSETSYLKAICFKEKPNLSTAEQFIAEGNYLWNSGIFVWNSSVLIDLFREFQPEIYRYSKKICDNYSDGAINEFYKKMPTISVDYGILEKTEDIFVIHGFFGWNDIGSWYAIEQLYQSDENGNTLIGPSVFYDVSNCTVISHESVTVCIGTSNLYIINTGTAVLIFQKERIRDLTNIVELLEQNGFHNLL